MNKEDLECPECKGKNNVEVCGDIICADCGKVIKEEGEK